MYTVFLYYIILFIFGCMECMDGWMLYLVYMYKYHDVHAVIYVVDSAAGDRLNETASLLQSTMQHNYLAGKPLLVLANKQDVAGAQSGKQIFDSLKLSSFQKASVAECMSIPLGGGEDPTAMDPRIESALESLLDTIQTNFEVLDQRVSADTKRKAEDESKKRLERERKVLRNKIACAFPDQVDPAFRPEAPSNPEDSFTKEEGETFLASEIGEDVAGMSETAKQIATLIGYQRLALQLVGALKAPISKKKVAMSWEEIRDLVLELRSEIGL